ncbi:MAG TPA: hypothetical protein VLN45_01505 [Ignavibacteriaceae bacterium]|nr:hypothetical protein [Ignavibacteriaceae bacterium]
MVRINSIFFLLGFSFIIPLNINGQSIIHPHKVGIGYHYSNSLDKNVTAYSHNFYFSSGKFDFYGSISSAEDEEQTISGGGVGFNIASIKEERKFIPSFSAFIGSVEDLTVLAIGPTMTFQLFDNETLRILPEAGCALMLIGLFSESVVSKSELSFYIGINHSIKIIDEFILTINPAYNITESISYFNISAGFSILLL